MTIEELNSELGDTIVNFSEYHATMRQMVEFYKNSCFYPTKSGKPSSDENRANLLKVFADKNIHYTSDQPIIKIPATADDRQSASLREKIVYAVRQKSNSRIIRRKQSRDATLMSAAITETGWDAKKRCAYIRRYDPRYCYWQVSNDNDGRVTAFWAVFPITADECERRYGKRPTTQGGLPISINSVNQYKHIDGKDWFLQAIRWTGKTKVAWVGDVFIEPEHSHTFNEIPIDIVMPFDECSENFQGGFYLQPLLHPQAELNDVMRKRSKIIARMSSPVIWGRNVMARSLDDVSAKLSSDTGGFLGLGRQGELGVLQIQDVKMLSEQEQSLVTQMMRLSGFSAAAFGESVGANTSGDALGMYFTPTQRLIEDQNIAWRAHDESVNAKILEAYANNMTINEQLSLDTYAPGSTVLSVDGNDAKYSGGIQTITFTKEDIGRNFANVCIYRNVTPKNEIAEKEWALNAVQQKVISRQTAYEMMDILSPEDELKLLTSEQSEPVLNPDGTQKILQSMPQLNSPAPVSGMEGLTNGA